MSTEREEQFDSDHGDDGDDNQTDQGVGPRFVLARLGDDPRRSLTAADAGIQ
jgi:hypothetical protein